jgi:hypothetical protein
MKQEKEVSYNEIIDMWQKKHGFSKEKATKILNDAIQKKELKASSYLINGKKHKIN